MGGCGGGERAAFHQNWTDKEKETALFTQQRVEVF